MSRLKNCIKEGQKGGRHKGLKSIPVFQERINGHIEKAKHNFKAMISFQKTGFSDWSASAAFYCLYHSLLAVLAKEGYESRNQNCTFAYIQDMIEKGKINLKTDELKEIYDSDVTENLENSDKILDIRENMQYSMKTFLEDEEYLSLKERTKQLFDKIRNELEESNEQGD
jgi:uncharacterized protein (UPF0332 family)